MNARPWFREPMLLLVFGLPAAAVVAGIATLVIAAGGTHDAGDPRVHRVAQTQSVDLAPDAAATRQALQAQAAFAADGAVRLRFPQAGAGAQSLRLALRHVTDSGRDQAAWLARAGEGVYTGRLGAPRAGGAYNAELAPADGTWRLVGRLEQGAMQLSLQPALEHR